MSLIYPMLAQIVLTLTVLILTARARVRVLRNREVRVTDIAVRGEAWPEPVRILTNNYANQFETPVLFYVLGLAAMIVGADGPVMVGLAWLFVATRVLHSLIHLNGNNVSRRFQVFVVGVLVLLVMVATLLASVIAAG